MIRDPGSLPGEFVFSKNANPDQNKAECLCFHWVIEGFYDTDFDHHIFNADPKQFFFLESLSLNNKKKYRFS